MYYTVINIYGIPHYIFEIFPQVDDYFLVVYTAHRDVFEKLSSVPVTYKTYEIRDQNFECACKYTYQYLVEECFCESVAVNSLQEFVDMMRFMYEQNPKYAERVRREWM